MLDIKKMLTKISKQMKEELVYQDYSCPAVSITAGSVGTFATGVNVGIEKSGYEVVSASAMTVGHSANYNFLYFIYNNKIYFTFYRVGTTAYNIPNGDIVIRVLYKKVGGGYCLNGLKAVFSMLSAIAERRWRHVRHQENADQIDAESVSRCRPVEGHRLCERISSDTIEKRMARCERRHRQRGDDSTDYSYHVGQQGSGRADRHHLPRLGGIRVLFREEGSNVYHRNIQMLSHKCASVLIGVALSEGGCF